MNNPTIPPIKPRPLSAAAVSQYAPKTSSPASAPEAITSMIERLTAIESYDRAHAALSLLNVFIAAVQRSAGRSYLNVQDFYAFLDALSALEKITAPTPPEQGQG